MKIRNKGQKYRRTKCGSKDLLLVYCPSRIDDLCIYCWLFVLILQSQDDSNRETAMYQPAAIFAAAIPPQGATTAHLHREAEQ